MKCNEVMSELERAGTEQNRKVYQRHGAVGPLFGVSFAALYGLQKRIKTDHALALELWATGNVDARTLAAMIAEPARFTRAQVDAWARDTTYQVLLDLIVKHVAAKTDFARELLDRWTASDDEWLGRAGFVLLVQLAADDPSLPDGFFEEHLAVIEASIHGAKNRTREAMNSALIGIGARNEALRDKALAVAKRIGKVEVDHGDTNCKTPYAVEYIAKIWTRTKPDKSGAGAQRPKAAAKKTTPQTVAAKKGAAPQTAAAQKAPQAAAAKKAPQTAAAKKAPQTAAAKKAPQTAAAKEAPQTAAAKKAPRTAAAKKAPQTAAAKKKATPQERADAKPARKDSSRAASRP